MSDLLAEDKPVPSILDMSDEELMKLDPSTLDQYEQPKPAEATGGVAPEVAEAGEENADEEVNELPEASHQSPASEETEDDSAEASETEVEQSQAAKSEAQSETTDQSDVVATSNEAKEIDYKAEYERLMQPFKANGRDIRVDSVDEAVALMQMGANYNKKMAALKPNLRLLKMLENNGLMEEGKLSFLIDLSKKDPQAIAKLVKDSEIHPMDLDTDNAGSYQPKKYSVDDREIELDSVLEEIQHTPSYARTVDIVGSKWDAASKQVIANTPQLLRVINDHVQRGIYDQIVQEIERERIFGRLSGLSDIEAYRQVGDAIQARGGFDHLAANAGSQGQQTPSRPVVVPPKPKSVDEDKLREKRKAASASKPASASAAPVSDFNPLALSDEDFSKLVKTQFL